ncbi:MAG: DUF4296 domain-containing protein [Flavobacterium sp.]
MKRIIIIICCAFSVLGCNSVDKPSNLIAKDKMIDILYDMSLLEAIKNQNVNGGITPKMGDEYIYKKYKIDSIQFVKSNKYYASDIDAYKKMFEEVKERLAKKTKETEAEMIKSGQQVPPTSPTPTNPDVPQVQ